MAVKRMVLRLQAETDALRDAAALICEIHKALARRHGEAFRRLERRIEAEMDRLTLTKDDMHLLGRDDEALVFTFTVPPVMAELIGEAVRLGVTPGA